MYGTVKPEVRSILEYFRPAYEEGVLDPDFTINSSSQGHEKLGSGKSQFYSDSDFRLNYTLSLLPVKPDALFWPVQTVGTCTRSPSPLRNTRAIATASRRSVFT